MPRPKSAASTASAAKPAALPTGAPFRCEACLLRPAREPGEPPLPWAFLHIPDALSQALPSRGLVSVEGTIGGARFAAALQPDGKGGHWLKVEPHLLRAGGAQPGQRITLAFSLAEREPEPEVPDLLAQALASAPPRAREVWSDITPTARRDFIHWIESAKREETRRKRTNDACDMLAKGKRRPCCFDRSGMYGKNLACPKAEPPASEAER